MKTTRFIHKEEQKGNWYLMDASNIPVGRLATMVAYILRGKHRPEFTPNVNHGDHVIVINASNLVFTGRKLDQKIYRHHSFFPGGLKETSARRLLEKHPDRIIISAVKGMLPKNRLGRQLLKKLRVFSGKEHPHEAQQPTQIKLSEDKIVTVDTSSAK